MTWKNWSLVLFGIILSGLGCTPRLQVEPITINMNVRIEHEVRVKVEKELDDLFEEESSLF